MQRRHVRYALSGAPRERLPRRRQLRHRRRHLLLRVDEHGPEGGQRFRPGADGTARRRQAPFSSSKRDRTRPGGSGRAAASRRHDGRRSGRRCRRRQDGGARWAATMRADDLHDLLLDNLEHPRWDDVAERCLSCGNCTMVCPTCFCMTVEDSQRSRRRGNVRASRRWDSCFTMDLSYVHGGSVRASAKSRYRQWMTHKLATWIDQFGTSGCVGCGRCITWCPVGIDITEEARRHPRDRQRRRHARWKVLSASCGSTRSSPGLDAGHLRAHRRLRATTCASRPAISLPRRRARRRVLSAPPRPRGASRSARRSAAP